MSVQVGWRPRQLSHPHRFGPPSRVHMANDRRTVTLCGAWLPAPGDVKDGDLGNLTGKPCRRCAALMEPLPVR